MNAVVQAKSNAVATTETYNPYESYANAVSSRTIIGDLLKFSKGEYTAGQNDEEVPMGTKLVANMEDLSVGWIKWVDGTPAEHVMGRVADGYIPVARKTLGDHDESEWDTDNDGRPRDPWQMTNYLLLKSTKSDDLFTFTTSSAGGKNAIAELCKQFGRQMRQHPDEHPVIEIGKDSYKHKVKEYGKIFTPKFTLVGWVDKTGFVTAMEAAAQADLDEDTEEAGAIERQQEQEDKIAAAALAKAKADSAKSGKSAARF